MRPHLTSTVLQPLVVVFAVIAAAWFLTVPALLSTSTFVMLFAFLAAFAWILKITYVNAQPASSLAQSLHDADAKTPGMAARRRR